MISRNIHGVLLAAVTAAQLGYSGAARAGDAPVPVNAAPAVVHITLDEAKARALGNNQLLNLAALNAQSKAFAVKAARADYFPKVVGTEVYWPFNDDLGTVPTTEGRTVTGPRGTPPAMFPAARTLLSPTLAPCSCSRTCSKPVRE